MGGDVRPDRETEELELRHLLNSGYMPPTESGGEPVPISEEVAKSMLADLDAGNSFSSEVVDVEYPEP